MTSECVGARLLHADPAHHGLQQVVVVASRCFEQEFSDLSWRDAMPAQLLGDAPKNGERVAVLTDQPDPDLWGA